MSVNNESTPKAFYDQEDSKQRLNVVRSLVSFPQVSNSQFDQYDSPKQSPKKKKYFVAKKVDKDANSILQQANMQSHSPDIFEEIARTGSKKGSVLIPKIQLEKLMSQNENSYKLPLINFSSSQNEQKKDINEKNKEIDSQYGIGSYSDTRRREVTNPSRESTNGKQENGNINSVGEYQLTLQTGGGTNRGSASQRKSQLGEGNQSNRDYSQISSILNSTSRYKRTRHSSSEYFGNIGNNLLNKHTSMFGENSVVNDGKNGPRYDQDGNIISRSVVGKSEWYINREKINELNRKRIREMGDPYGKSRSLRRENSISIVSALKSDKEKKKLVINKVMKRQLLDQADVIIERINKNKQLEELQLQNLPINEKMLETKDQRVLAKHDLIEQQWQKFIEKSALALQRDFAYNNLIFNQARQDQYRGLREATEVINVCKADLEISGARGWQFTLRQLEDEEIKLRKSPKKDTLWKERLLQIQRNKELLKNKKQFLDIYNLPYESQNQILYGEKSKNLEIVRKPYITDPVAALSNGLGNDENNGDLSNHEKLLQLHLISEILPFQSLHNKSRKDSQIQLDFLTSHDSSLYQQNNIESAILQDEDVKEEKEKQIPQNIKKVQVVSPSNTNTNDVNEVSEEKKNNNSGNNLQNQQSQVIHQLSSLNTSNLDKSRFLPLLERSSSSIGQNSFLLTSLKQPFSTFKSQEYYDKKISQIKNVASEFKPFYEMSVDYRGLAVIGESKLNSEVGMVKRTSDYALFTKMNIDQNPPHLKEEEYL